MRIKIIKIAIKIYKKKIRMWKFNQLIIFKDKKLYKKIGTIIRYQKVKANLKSHPIKIKMKNL